MSDNEKPASLSFAWGDPPPLSRVGKGGGRQVSKHWAEVSSLLKDNEGEWAQVSVHDNPNRAANFAASIRSGKSGAFRPARHFDAVSRPVNSEDGTHGVFARYVGAPVVQDVDYDEMVSEG